MATEQHVQLYESARRGVTVLAEGVELLQRVQETYDARGGETGYLANKHTGSNLTEAEQEENAEIDRMNAAILEIAGMSNRLQANFLDANEDALIARQRTDV